MRRPKIIIYLPFLVILSFIKTNAEIIASVKFNGKSYYVDVLDPSSKSILKAEVWFRLSNNASSTEDIKIFEIKANIKLLSDYASLVCRSKNILDGGKTILGCTSVIGSVFCAVGSVTTDGALAFVCESTWKYAVEYGAADCLEGVADAIAAYLGKQKEWKLLGAGAQLTDPKLLEAISTAIDFMCEDIENKND